MKEATKKTETKEKAKKVASKTNKEKSPIKKETTLKEEKIKKENKVEKVSKEEKKIAKEKIDKESIAPKTSQEIGKKEAILDKEPIKKRYNTNTSSSKNWGIIYIYSSYNNTHLHVTDITGSETLVKVTGGMVTKSDRLKASPNIAMAVAKQVSEGCHSKGITSLYVKLRAVGGHNGPSTPGPGAQAAIKMLTRYGIKLGRIEDITPIPHDSCRRKGGKRGRRV